ncbi:putative glutathione S-transferase enzyme with thioredoxin-like domain [Pseudoalteromonas distincta]|uniref:glutathione S-transferase family protein n=1 Tax=Pseudoalteromonas distincta TaxID=77608 RepID=UPI00020A0218|nr:glutathione S-transferase family protein [Pseudoalteromonas distincta]EGI75034.1 putative glutathione S-transferase enzyme with thioredoxin-like domain [Pseudoalteromonas distincta]
MQLIGSVPSPYVRRIRIWAQQNNCKLELVSLDIFSEQDRPTMASKNPARKIPILVDGDLTLSDSNSILRYLLEKTGQPKLTWPQEHLLTTINACNDSLVEMLLCERSGFDTKSDKLFFNLQNERIEQTLSFLNTHLSDEEFKSCEYLNISLYCLLDWICFRELTDFSQYSELVAFHKQYGKRQASSSNRY